MPLALVDAILRGSLLLWASFALLWALLAVGLLVERRGRPTPARVLLVLAAAMLTALVGLVIAPALAIPRVRWRAADGGLLLTPADAAAPHGEAAWRSLHGPAVAVTTDEGPDATVPVIDAEGRWVLFAILSGRPVPGLAPAPEALPPEGAPRLCAHGGGPCRAWPESWPAPAPPAPRGDLLWSSKEPLGALAFDVETQRYLRTAALGSEGPALDLAGDLSASASVGAGAGRGAGAEVQVFVLRRVMAGRLSAARVVASHGEAGAPRFRLERAEVSLSAGQTALAAVIPALGLGVAGLPIGVVTYLFAPAWLAARLRRCNAVLRELSAPLTLDPLLDREPAPRPDRRRVLLAAVREDADLGDALLPRGEVVQVAASAAGDASITAQRWYELPSSDPGEPLAEGVLVAGAAVRHEERGARRKVGVLVPADPEPLREVARGWMSLALHPLAVALAGVAAAAPAVVGVVTLVAAR